VTRSLRFAWRSQGTLGLIQSAKDRLAGTRSSLSEEALAVADGAGGLEIGGPSGRFRQHGMLPLYPALRSIDNVNYAAQTLWGEALEEGAPYVPAGRPTGVQFLREATDLLDIPEDSYDVVLSSHCLEHIANPLRALREWRRVCRPDGHLCLIVPHRDGTFDRKPPVTLIEHYRSDDENNVDEDDDTHFDEVIRCHDLRRDPGVRTSQDLEHRVANNRTVRGVHHHVFDLRNAALLIGEAGWTPTAAEARRPYDILVLAQNSTAPPTGCELRSILRGSPFRSHR
jgi:SAM-dependent methyltransferase